MVVSSVKIGKMRALRQAIGASLPERHSRTTKVVALGKKCNRNPPVGAWIGRLRALRYQTSVRAFNRQFNRMEFERHAVGTVAVESG
jgi:hypothetical protein